MYSVIYDESCVGIDFNFLTDEEKQLIPGDTDLEKREKVNEAQKVIMNTIEDFRP